MGIPIPYKDVFLVNNGQAGVQQDPTVLGWYEKKSMYVCRENFSTYVEQSLKMMRWKKCYVCMN